MSNASTSNPTAEVRPLFVVMLGGIDGDGLEGLMRRGLEASALDLLEAAGVTARYADCVLVSDRPPDAELPDGARLVLDDVSQPFHFGRQLAAVVGASGADRFVYAGAGAGPLLGPPELEALADGLEDGDGVCVTNNFYSADLFAVRPAELLARVDPWPPADNGVPRALKEQFEIETRELPRTTATQLNLDSPIDLVALALAGAGGPRLSALLREWAPDTDRAAAAARKFTDPHAEVLVAGRVSSRAWQYLERETACRVRMLAEERGMTAAGRDADGSARSILGQLIEAVGPERCFGELIPDLCDAAFIDLRPTLAHLGIHARPSDRFAADLGQAEAIEDAELRAIVAAANASPVPVVLGGHSLVVGALMLLNDWVWDEHDRLAAAGKS
jgi:hypothetical protein